MELVAEGSAMLEAFRARLLAPEPEAGPPSGPFQSAAQAKDVRQLGAEADFAFMMALRAWPNNAEAAARRQDCLEQLIDYELGARNGPGARSLLGHLPVQRPDLERRIQAVEVALERDAGAAEELERLARERDFGISSSARVQALLVVHTVLLLISGPLAWRGVALTSGVLLAIAAGGVGAYALLATVRRATLFATQANRRMQLSLAIWLGSGVLVAAAGAHLDVPVQTTLNAIILLGAFAALQVAVWTERTMWVYPVLWGVVAAVTWLRPVTGFVTVAMVSVASLLGGLLRIALRYRRPMP
jgi:hypothetical protein